MIHFPLLALFVLGATTPDDPSTDAGWHQWRGPQMNGVAPHANPPVEWSEEKNIKWKAEIPGHGLSTPIVVGDLVILQTAIPAKPAEAQAAGDVAEAKPEADRPTPAEGEGGQGEDRRRGAEGDGQGGPPPEGERRGDGPPGGRGRRMRAEAPTDPYRFTVIALDRKTGKQVWERTVREMIPHEGSHSDGSLAPASPVTDGEHIFAYFGSRGLYCLTLKGDVVWEKDFGDMQTAAGFGEGSSPALHGDTLVVNWDHEGEDFIVALDKKTGDEKWRRERDERTSWSTPLIIERDGKAQVIVSATTKVRSYDLKTGETIWEAGGLGANCAPTPVADANLVFAMSGYQDPALLAIRYTDAKGDVTDSASIAWKTNERTSYVPSALLYGDTMYFLQKSNGTLSCLDPATGKRHFLEQHVKNINGVYSSPVGAADRVYIVGRNGTTQVIKRGKKFESLAANKLDDEFTASPAIVGNELFLRGHKRLYCIATP